MYVNKYDRRNSASIGNKAERVFISLAGQRGYQIHPSSSKQNRLSRIDYFLEKNGISRGVDVKARKKVCAYDKDYNDQWTWVEFQNADGFGGWLYGEAYYIAFEKKDEFIIVSREDLKNLCEKIIDKTKEYVYNCQDAKYRIYQRRGQEEIALIQTSDIKKIKNSATWKKNNGF